MHAGLIKGQSNVHSVQVTQFHERLSNALENLLTCSHDDTGVGLQRCTYDTCSYFSATMVTGLREAGGLEKHSCLTAIGGCHYNGEQ